MGLRNSKPCSRSTTVQLNDIEEAIERLSRELGGWPTIRVQELKRRGDPAYGYCTPADGLLQIKLRSDNGVCYSPLFVWKIVAHELAHIWHPTHSHAWRRLQRKLSRLLREQR
jgi:predicted metal-dependent hydrolase